MKKTIVAAMLVATALTTVSLNAVAQTFSPTQGYTEQQVASVNALISQMAAINDPIIRTTMLRAFLATNASSAPLLIQALKSTNPALAREVFQEVVTILSEDPNNSDLIATLMEQNEDLVAQTSNEIEPAAAPIPNILPPNVGNVTEEDSVSEENTENPGQLSSNTPAAQ